MTNEQKEMYWKMMAFRYEFPNGWEYTEEELKFYREHFNDFYVIKEIEEVFGGKV